jgi:PhnB protein
MALANTQGWQLRPAKAFSYAGAFLFAFIRLNAVFIRNPLVVAADISSFSKIIRMKLIPYILFNGNCEEAMQFYAQALGATITHVQRYSESPMPTEEAQKNKIIHAGMQFGEQPVYFSDSMANNETQIGNNVQLSLDYDNDAEMDRAFAAMAEGGQITMPLQDTFWNARFGMLIDKFGVRWMFNHNKEKQ